MNTHTSGTKHQPSVPGHNILDLRQVLAVKQAPPVERRGRAPRAKIKRPAMPRFIPRDWQVVRREVFKFSAALLAVVVPLAGVFALVRVSQAAQAVQHRAEMGFHQVESGVEYLGQRQFAQAEQQFRLAEQQLRQTQTHLTDTVGPSSIWQRLPWAGQKYQTAENILQAGVLVARAGQSISGRLVAVPVEHQEISVTNNGVMEGSFGLLQPFLTKPDVLRSAVDDIEQAFSLLAAIEPGQVPEAYQPQVVFWQRISPWVNQHQLKHMTDILLGLTSTERPQEYLVILQNNDELRPTGGFPGTYLLVKFDSTGFKILDAPGNGPYALSNQIPRTALPPQPLQTISTSWNFQDSTWFLDVPTSARFMLDFYQQARGFRPDGIIFINPALVESLLTYTGPLSLPSYQTMITAENFLRTTEEQVELKYDKALNAPKRFLIDMIPMLVTKLSTVSSTEGWKAFLTSLEHINQGQVLMHSSQAAVQQAITSLGWHGSIPSTSDDYLAVVDSNLGGTKTDRVVKEQVTVDVTPDQDRIQYRVRVTRSHQGSPNDQFAGKNNTSFIRVYAPGAAVLSSVEGNTHPRDLVFLTPEPTTKPTPALLQAEGRVIIDETAGVRVTKENGKNVFGTWLRIEPGEEKTVTFSYSVPRPEKQGQYLWNLYWQKQPGAPLRSWQVNVHHQGKTKVKPAAANVAAKLNDQGLSFSTDSSYSRTFSAVID